jgi:hypothetical protein
LRYISCLATWLRSLSCAIVKYSDCMICG